MAVRYSPDGNLLVVRTFEGVVVHDAVTGDQTMKSSVQLCCSSVTTPAGMDIDPSSSQVSYVTNDTLVITPLSEQQQDIRMVRAHPGGAVAFSPDGQRLAVSAGGFLETWRLNRLIGPARTATTSADNSLAYAPDGRTLASAGFSTSNLIMLWDTRSWAIQDSLVGHPSYVNEIVFSRDGRYLASGGGRGGKRMGGTIIWWDVRARVPIWRRDFEDCCPGQFIALSPDAHWIATGSGARILLLSTRDGRMVHSWVAHTTQGLKSAAFHPSGLRLATLGYDGLLKQWELGGILPLEEGER